MNGGPQHSMSYTKVPRLLGERVRVRVWMGVSGTADGEEEESSSRIHSLTHSMNHSVTNHINICA